MAFETGADVCTLDTDDDGRLKEIKVMVDDGAYFAINKARQYGKTTTLQALAEFLKKDYLAVSLDFQRLGSLSFENEQSFVAAFSEELLYSVESFPEGVAEKFRAFVEETARINSLQALFKAVYLWCGKTEKPIVLLIDEVDSAANNQVFLDFLAQLRAAYLDRDRTRVGNYYIESRTRNQERTDFIVDYLGEQFIIEMKVWRRNAYNERGEEQLLGESLG